MTQFNSTLSLPLPPLALLQDRKARRPPRLFLPAPEPRKHAPAYRQTRREIDDGVPEALQRQHDRRADVERERGALGVAQPVDAVHRRRDPGDEDGDREQHRALRVRPFHPVHAARPSRELQPEQRACCSRRRRRRPAVVRRDGDGVLVSACYCAGGCPWLLAVALGVWLWGCFDGRFGPGLRGHDFDFGGAEPGECWFGVAGGCHGAVGGAA